MPFRFLKNFNDQNSDQSLGKYINWKPPMLYKGKRWWIEYQFHIPYKLRHRQNGAKWKGFPIFEDINLRHQATTTETSLIRRVTRPKLPLQ